MFSSLLLLNLLPLAIAAPAKRAEPAPLLVPRGDTIPDKYIVKYKETFDMSAADITIKEYHAKAEKTYSHVFNGFAGALNATSIETLRNHPAVSLTAQAVPESFLTPHIG